MFLSSQNPASTLTNTPNPNSTNFPQRVTQTQAEVARTDVVAKRVLDAVGLDRRSPDALLDDTTVTANADADILEIRVRDPSARLAQLLASEYASQFARYRRELDTAAIRRARQEVQERLRQLRARDSDSSLRQDLLTRSQQLQTLELLQTSNAFVVRKAPAATLVQPKTVRNVVVAAVLGLLLAVGLAFLREVLDTRVRNADEVAERLHLPLLARIPPPRREAKGEPELAMVADTVGEAAEAFRMLRTSFEFANLDRGARTVLFTSALRGEGKSTTLANLGVALALSGRDVTLVDLDLRRPALDQFFGVGGPGVTAVALGRAHMDDALRRVSIVSASVAAGVGGPPSAGDGTVGLNILPAGTTPPDPGEFVGGDSLADILLQLRTRSELILIDAPPVMAVGDALTLSKRVDAMLAIVRLGLVDRRVLNELARVLHVAPAEKLGFVVTGAEPDDRYDYGYGYSA